MKKGELIWFVLCLLMLLWWSYYVIFLDDTPPKRMVSVAIIILETLCLATSWRKLTTPETPPCR